MYLSITDSLTQILFMMKLKDQDFCNADIAMLGTDKLNK